MKPPTLATLLPLFDTANAQELTPTQRALMREKHSNIYTSGVLLSSEALIFTNELSHCNWRYYVGLEYVEKRHVTIVQQGEDFFLAIYSTNSDRIGELQSELEVETQVADAQPAHA